MEIFFVTHIGISQSQPPETKHVEEVRAINSQLPSRPEFYKIIIFNLNNSVSLTEMLQIFLAFIVTKTD